MKCVAVLFLAERRNISKITLLQNNRLFVQVFPPDIPPFQRISFSENTETCSTRTLASVVIRHKVNGHTCLCSMQSFVIKIDYPYTSRIYEEAK